MHTATRFLLLVSPLRHKLLTPPSLSPLTRRHLHIHLTRRSLHSHQHATSNYDPTFSTPETHRFRAWSNFINALSSQNYFSQQVENEFIASDNGNLPDEFVRSANACFAFARHRPLILRLLPRRDVEVVVENVRPVLFRNGEDSVRKLRVYLGSGQSSGLDADRAEMIDLMRLLLSYVSNPVVSLEKTSSLNSELLEASVQNLLSELAKQSRIASNPELVGSVKNQFLDRCARSPRQFGQNIEMKRGDWICPRCSFMNFARNIKCLECEEARPKRQLTGGEWECPQCGFFNFGGNMACVRCDCKQPGDGSVNSTNLMGGPGYRNGSTADKTNLDRRLAVNDEKAQRWFSKISQLDSTSDMNSAIADEDFPDIMPLRKGVNRFVVSTRKTPLDRRLANAMYRRSLGNNGSPEVGVPTGGVNKTNETKVSQTLDEILGHRPGVAPRTNNIPSSSSFPQHEDGSSNTSNYTPPAPLLLEMTAKCSENKKLEGESSGPINGSTEAGILGETSQYLENLVRRADNNDVNREHDRKPEGWLDENEEMHGVKDMATYKTDHATIMMPIHEGENQSVVGKQRDLLSASPMYKRYNVLEQTGNSSFVPFVPFPPDYFARKDKQSPDGTHSTGKAADETSNLAVSEKPPENFNCTASAMSDGRNMQMRNHQHRSTGDWNSRSSGESHYQRELAASHEKQSTGSIGRSSSYQVDRTSSLIGEHPLGSVNERRNMGSSSPQPSENLRGSWTGKSLEGSAVKEPDPLDMSEEAKAERWFRRVAQIKDISELSQIPDEDFPSIMPMRKGVNRFVVSKRKTPLERRLTSSQYKRNLPIVSSDSSLKTEFDKKENENK